MEETLNILACMIILDFLGLHRARKMLFDFLIGQKGGSNKAKKIHANQPLFDCISMSYILQYLTRYQSDFKKYHSIYKVMMYMLLPQYCVIGVFSVFFYDENIFLLIVCLFILVKIALTLLFFGAPRGHTIYAKKRSHIKKRR